VGAKARDISHNFTAASEAGGGSCDFALHARAQERLLFIGKTSAPKNRGSMTFLSAGSLREGNAEKTAQ
jgi:hypothetical protein